MHECKPRQTSMSPQNCVRRNTIQFSGLSSPTPTSHPRSPGLRTNCEELATLSRSPPKGSRGVNPDVGPGADEGVSHQNHIPQIHRATSVAFPHTWRPDGKNDLQIGTLTSHYLCDPQPSSRSNSPLSPYHVKSLPSSPRRCSLQPSSQAFANHVSPAKTFVQSIAERRHSTYHSPPKLPPAHYRCTFVGCTCMQYSLSSRVSGMTNEELLASGLTVQLCMNCSHGIGYHNAEKDISTGTLNVQTLVANHASVPSIRRQSYILPEMQVAVNFKCKVDDCQCDGYRISSEVGQLTVDHFLALPSASQQCTGCHHGLAHHPDVMKCLGRATVTLQHMVSSTSPIMSPITDLAKVETVTPASSPTQEPLKSFQTTVIEKVTPASSPTREPLKSFQASAAIAEPFAARSSSTIEETKPQRSTSPPQPAIPLGLLREPPPDMLCPITHELMVEPVILADGHSYELAVIEKWLANHDVSPMTGEVLPSKRTTPNITLKKLIGAWKDES